MRIAQIAPLWESVPPVGYGGTELIVSLLTEELVKRGHEVTLFAAGNSHTAAALEPGCDTGLRMQGKLPIETMVYEQMQMGKLFQRANDFDILHCHVDYVALPYVDLVDTPVVHTLHRNEQHTNPIFQRYQHQNFISLSQSHRRTELELNYVATVYNAIAVDEFEFRSIPAEPPYLLFLGRFSEIKGPHLAIEIAKRSGLTLKLAGKVDFKNQDFFDDVIQPELDHPLIEFLGEVSHEEKKRLLQGATATLFPIQWSEPFGLVMVESMACGTPVIAMARGAAPEVIAQGQTGFLCHTVDECVDAVTKVPFIDRFTCREHIQSRFSIPTMVDNYEAVYRSVIATQCS